MDEVIKSIKAFLYDRTVSPLFGAFIAAWSVCNYRVIVALLDGDASLSDKIKFLDEYFGVVTYQFSGLSFQGWGQVVHGFLEPALLTLIYLFIYPWLAKPVYEHSLTKQKELKDIKQKAESIRLLSVEESRNLIKEIEQLRYKADEDAQKYRARIDSLTETINSLEASKNSSSLINTEGSLVGDYKPLLALDEFGNQLRSKVDALPDGEFQLPELLESEDWKKLSEANRKGYGKLFKQLVERGDFAGVAISGKATGNQLIYRKGVASSPTMLTDLESELLRQLQAVSFDSDEKRVDLIKNMVAYCVNNKISEEMFWVLSVLTRLDGRAEKRNLRNILQNKLNSIELDFVLKRLDDYGLVRTINENVLFTDEGNKMAVNSELTKLDKALRKANMGWPIRE